MKDSTHGPRIYKALEAVAKMHEETSRLLVDCDSLFADRRSVFGNYATRELTRNVSASFWMAEGVYRYWHETGAPLAGVSALFYDGEGRMKEPLFVVGRLSYVELDDSNVRGKCQPWDLWCAVLKWSEEIPQAGLLHTISPEAERQRISEIVFELAPLYDIESLQDVREMFRRCGVDTSE